MLVIVAKSHRQPVEKIQIIIMDSAGPRLPQQQPSPPKLPLSLCFFLKKYTSCIFDHFRTV